MQDQRELSWLKSSMAYFEYGHCWIKTDGVVEVSPQVGIFNATGISESDAQKVIATNSEVPIPSINDIQSIGLYCVSVMNKNSVNYDRDFRRVIPYRLPFQHILWACFEGRVVKNKKTTYTIIVLNKQPFNDEMAILEKMGNVTPHIVHTD